MDYGNEFIGDLSALAAVAEPAHRRVFGNWFKGTLSGSGLSVEAKIFAEGSVQGLGGGRISKLAIWSETERAKLTDFFAACETHYDRRWDVKPTTPEAWDRCRAVVEALGGSMDVPRPASPAAA
jgi:hypothetical protein